MEGVKMIPVKEIMSKDVIFVRPDMPIFEALEMLKKYKVSGFPVINEENEVVGILSEKDVLTILFDNNPEVHYTVEKYMSHDVLCFLEDDDAVEVCKAFINKSIRRVPIVRDNKLIGIVSRRDIVVFILEAKSKFSELRYA